MSWTSLGLTTYFESFSAQRPNKAIFPFELFSSLYPTTALALFFLTLSLFSVSL